MSIHQPRYSIFKQFDSLTLLSVGNMIYHGNAHKALEYFDKIGEFLCVCMYLLPHIHSQGVNCKVILFIISTKCQIKLRVLYHQGVETLASYHIDLWVLLYALTKQSASRDHILLTTWK